MFKLFFFLCLSFSILFAIHFKSSDLDFNGRFLWKQQYLDACDIDREFVPNRHQNGLSKTAHFVHKPSFSVSLLPLFSFLWVGEDWGFEPEPSTSQVPAILIRKISQTFYGLYANIENWPTCRQGSECISWNWPVRSAGYKRSFYPTRSCLWNDPTLQLCTTPNNCVWFEPCGQVSNFEIRKRKPSCKLSLGVSFGKTVLVQMWYVLFYVPHYDFLRRHHDLKVRGNRMASLVFILSTAEFGGGITLRA